MKHRQSIQELVRLDLVDREKADQPTAGYTGREAILDAYDAALDLCCYLRQVIEDLMTDSNKEQPEQQTQEPPHFRAAREHTQAEFGWFKTLAQGPGA